MVLILHEVYLELESVKHRYHETNLLFSHGYYFKLMKYIKDIKLDPIARKLKQRKLFFCKGIYIIVASVRTVSVITYSTILLLATDEG